MSPGEMTETRKTLIYSGPGFEKSSHKEVIVRLPQGAKSTECCQCRLNKKEGI